MVSLGFPHAFSEDFTYQGYTIPKGTLIMANIDELHRASERYDDADRFEPERYLGDDLDAYSSAKQSDYMKRDHCNYGFGRRICAGTISYFFPTQLETFI
jgi:cytochrome P450